MNAIKICLKEFKKRFRRVFFTPGNHDLWIRKDTSDAKIYPDSIAKLAAMHNVCQEVRRAHAFCRNATFFLLKRPRKRPLTLPPSFFSLLACWCRLEWTWARPKWLKGSSLCPSSVGTTTCSMRGTPILAACATIPFVFGPKAWEATFTFGSTCCN